MRLPDIGHGPATLGYCLNVHATETVAEFRRAIGIAGSIARRLGENPLGVGIRLGDDGVRAAAFDSSLVAKLADEMKASGLLPFTFNAFPQAPFHAERVKTNVYRPNWTEPERLRYTIDAACILADWLGDDTTVGTVSTVPVGWRGDVDDRDDVAARQLVALALELSRLEEDTGKTIIVCLEPEPGCRLQSTRQAVDFFQDTLWPFAEQARRTFGPRAPDAVRRHLAVCYDTCHQAVLFEDPLASLDALAAAGIAIGKMQLSSALHLDFTSAAELDALLRWNEPRFLHQVVVRGEDGRFRAFDDLPGLAEARDGGVLPASGQARCHFHVPIDRDPSGPLASTRSDLIAAATHARRRGLTSHFEVETYTFDVLPADVRDPSIEAQLAAEVSFARSLLLECGSGSS